MKRKKKMMKEYSNFTNGMNNSSFIMMREENLTELYQEIKSLKYELSNLKEIHSKKIYNNNEIKNLLGVQDKLLKKYRDDGLLAYSQVGDKYWYTEKDIDQFLAHTHQIAYSFAS